MRLAGYAIYSDRRGIVGYGDTVEQAIENYRITNDVVGSRFAVMYRIRMDVKCGVLHIGRITVALRNSLRNWNEGTYIEIGRHGRYPVLGTVDECSDEMIEQKIAEIESKVGDLHGIGGWVVYHRGPIYAVGRTLREALENYGNLVGRSVARTFVLLREGLLSLGLATSELYAAAEKDRLNAKYAETGRSISIYPILNVRR